MQKYSLEVTVSCAKVVASVSTVRSIIKAAGFNENAAELYGLVALNTIRNGSIDSHEADVNSVRVEELSKDLEPTIVRAMQHYSKVDDDVRGNRLRSLSAMEGLGTR